jgi:hypothetical protein
METYNNMYLDPNAKAILHTFELEEMFKKKHLLLGQIVGASHPPSRFQNA